MIEIIPAIDIIDGRAVRLSKGDYSTRKEYGDPVEVAKEFAGYGARSLHLVDLDGAKSSQPCNLRTLEAIAGLGVFNIEWGGGLKTKDSLRSVFDAGASQGIVGSLAALKPALFEEWLTCFGPDKLILGADVLDGKVRVNGWMEGTDIDLQSMLSRFLDAGLKYTVCTDISRDGMLCGPSVDLYCRIAEQFPSLILTVSGGISSMKDIEDLNLKGLPKVIVGKAYYEGRITIEDLKQWWQNA